MRPRTLSVVILLFIILTSLTAFSQQDYVNRFDAYAGYGYFSTPSLNLSQNGFNGEFGWNAKSWVALGFDFSVFTGDNVITPNMLTPALQQTLSGEIAVSAVYRSASSRISAQNADQLDHLHLQCRTAIQYSAFQAGNDFS